MNGANDNGGTTTRQIEDVIGMAAETYFGLLDDSQVRDSAANALCDIIYAALCAEEVKRGLA